MTEIFSNESNNKIKPFIITGLSDTGIVYYLTSQTSSNYVNNILNNENIFLGKPYLKLILKNGDNIMLRSQEGILNHTAKTFQMKEGVRIFKTDREFLHTQIIDINLQDHTLASKNAIYGQYGNVSLKSQGVMIDLNTSKIVISPFYEISNLSDKSFKISGQGYVHIDVLNKLISTSKNVFCQTEKFNIYADAAKIWYVDLSNFADNLQNNVYDNFKRIELNNNVMVAFADNKITADQYIYDVKQQVMILRGGKNNTVKYEHAKFRLTSDDRFEYLHATSTLVSRGKSILYIKNANNLEQISYKITQDLISAKLDKNHHLHILEAFDNVTIEYNNSTIKAAYLQYNTDLSSMLLEDNVQIMKDNQIVSGCRLIINLKNNETSLLPCDPQEQLKIQKLIR